MTLGEWEALSVLDGSIIFTRFITISESSRSSVILVSSEHKQWEYKIRYISNYLKDNDLIYRNLSVYESWSIWFAETKELAMLHADLRAIEMGYNIENPLTMIGCPIY